LLLGPLPEPLWRLQAALAAQCFINEYIWPVTAEETAAISRLMASPLNAETILRLAAYVPLYGVPGVAELVPGEWPDAVQAVLRQQVSEPAAEQKLAASIPLMTAIRDGVSSAVRRQYEEHPYPRWVRAPRQQPERIERVLRSALPFAELAPLPNPDAPEILVAGCGTGHHALHVAQRYRGARVTAVDLSLASLSYAKRKAEELGVRNIAFAQADLLEIDGRQFDVVDAAGSLQCLADTAEGVRVLSRALRPGGLFRFGLYSAMARRGLQAARDLGATYPASADGIRAFRQVVLGAPADSALKSGVFPSSDFFSASGCRDMLMHVQEHQHTTDDLRRLLDDAELRFLGFVLPPETLNAYRREHPGDQAGLNLAQWGAFETRNPSAFRRMYQFWAQKGG
jgi:SAM-dependent methyltransferase